MIDLRFPNTSPSGNPDRCYIGGTLHLSSAALFHKAEILIAFTIFGLMPLYLNLMPGVRVESLVSLRIILASTILVALMTVGGRWRPMLAQIRRHPKSLLYCTLAAPLVATGGLLSSWAFMNQQILAASLGQYLSPFISVLLAVLLFRDRPTRFQCLALVLAAAGLTLHFGQQQLSAPLALLMGTLFALYGALKKLVRLDTLTSITLEHLAVLPLALGYWLYLEYHGLPGLLAGSATELWLQLGFAPLVLFAVALLNHGVRRVNFSTFGLMQFLDPSLQFLIGIWVFHELCPPEQLLGFMLIWGGLTAVIGSGLFRGRTAEVQTTHPRVRKLTNS